MWGQETAKRGSSQKTAGPREFPGGPVLGTWPSEVGATRDSIPGWGAEVPHA